MALIDSIALARAARDRQRRIVRMRQAGATLQEIGDKFGISKQRVQQILDKIPRG